MINRARYAMRRVRNRLFLGLSIAAAGFGLVWLGFILAALLQHGIAGFSIKVFTELTPPPGEKGGLSNAIMGSLIMSVMAVVIGTPIGIMAGTYLAEYGRHSRIAFISRFINDILLSTPSIITGLFIYVLLVLPTSPLSVGFSGWAGSAALAVLVIPVVVRTTENMLLLVPNSLREAAAALGAPRGYIVRTVTWRAAKTGIVTGVLLAVARISGETAPLLFTAFGNSSWTVNPNSAMASLPQVIFNYAMSPYADWHALAWAGALLITATVLTLSIIARLLDSSKRKQS